MNNVLHSFLTHYKIENPDKWTCITAENIMIDDDFPQYILDLHYESDTETHVIFQTYDGMLHNLNDLQETQTTYALKEFIQTIPKNKLFLIHQNFC